jgi:hypothetical protein
VRKLTFDAAAPTTARKAAAPTPKPSAAEAPKTRGGIKFELGKDAMAVSCGIATILLSCRLVEELCWDQTHVASHTLLLH